MAECMTPEERAGKVSGAYQFPQGVENHIADAIAAAVAEERERIFTALETGDFYRGFPSAVQRAAWQEAVDGLRAWSEGDG